ncbi:MAG: hypothetical protein JO117_03255 [Verrucomicrobia bacterium]|nr:hypothetical protein [Verrucomicrobiota bacterium]
MLKRSVNGFFRHRQQVVHLGEATGLTLESRLDSAGAGRKVRRQYLYLDGPPDRVLLNDPSKLYLDHRKLGKILHEATHLPYREVTDGIETAALAGN